MKRPMLLLSVGVVAVVLAACGGKKPQTTVAPQPNADSIAAAEKARQEAMAAADAERRAREEAERVARQKTADSLAALGRSGIARIEGLVRAVERGRHVAQHREPPLVRDARRFAARLAAFASARWTFCCSTLTLASL